MFERVVLVQFPRPGSYAIGFLTGRLRSEMQDATGEELWNIFVPTTPNPTSGFLILLPRREVQELTMSIGDGMKLIISGGAVGPAWPRENGASPVEPASREASSGADLRT